MMTSKTPKVKYDIAPVLSSLIQMMEKEEIILQVNMEKPDSFLIIGEE